MTDKLLRKYNVKPEFERFKKFHMPRNLFAMFVFNQLMKFTNLFVISPKNIKVSKKHMITRDQKQILLTVYSPQTYEGNLPCLIYYPGGGFMMGANMVHKRTASQIAILAHCHVILVHYRLAPKYLFPTALYDASDAFLWIVNQAEEYHIDKSKIAVGGDSSGGSLAAGTLLMMRDQNGPKACLQVLIYPALDKLSADSSSRRKLKTTPVFNTRNFAFINKIVYKNGYFGLKNYAYPLSNDSFINLPPTYIETAEFDCLHDDGIRYSAALKEAGIEVVLVETKGTFHGYDAEAKSPLVKKCMMKRIEALKKAFS